MSKRYLESEEKIALSCHRLIFARARAPLFTLSKLWLAFLIHECHLSRKKTNRYLLLDGYSSFSLPSSFSLLLGIVHGLFTLFNKHEFKDHPGVKVIKKIGTLIGETACDLTLEGMVSHCMSEAT